MKNSQKLLAITMLTSALSVGTIMPPVMAAEIRGGEDDKASRSMQEASPPGQTKQGRTMVLPHRELTYESENTAYIDQENIIDDTSIDDSYVDQENNAYVEQGTVEAMPHSTVHYEGKNKAYVDQENTIEDTSSDDSYVDQENNAYVEQGTVKRFPHSNVD